jgi:transposase
MSEKELRRAEVLARVKAGELQLRNAAELMELSYRQGKRLWRRYRAEGAAGLQHRSAGRRSHRAKPQRFREKVLRLVRRKYGGEVALVNNLVSAQWFMIPIQSEPGR